MLELAILGLLLESPMHGYELRKRLTGLLGAFRAFSYGSLYPALRRMQADGLIVEDAAPDGTPKMRRARRVYQLTDAGKQRFTELVADTGPQNYTDDGFGVHLAFFNRTPAEARMRILEGRRRQVEERREGLREAVARASSSLDRYTRQLHQLGLGVQRARSEMAQRTDRGRTRRRRAAPSSRNHYRDTSQNEKEKSMTERHRGPGRDCRRRQLRVLAGAGRAVLPGRRRERHRSRPDARAGSARTTSAT